MQCTECKKGDTKVIDSRDDQKTIRRRRECLKCGFRFTTYEKIEIPAIKIEKRDGRIENYQKEKIRNGILKSLEKRAVDENIICNLIDDIEHTIVLLDKKTVPSILVGEIVSKKLRKIDDVAYLRFVSVYKSFSSAKSFASEAKKLVPKKTK
ncbi:transcriptional regulator NrdR [Candidatus Berkelbacteria bacterium CG08_land_8_20_14_0_20_39_8]|uniref:Transcriptional repressor NrdR n=1 Tax=Candidatus Berkelbacteria bacterium CG08_land_8_20_14_0_20_39_8 TaxID=1974511 RepID=A0A2M6YBR8_9BACT|nr:MAG: transcriptional regulator NrdR [Candidatus Berkelbacteria bacterium CG08_land_8_20_14_0_20_39_8]